MHSSSYRTVFVIAKIYPVDKDLANWAVTYCQQR